MRQTMKSGPATVFAALASALCAFVSPAQPESPPPAPALLRQMEGQWLVAQRMWPGPGAAAVNLPPAVANRKLIQNVFLEEVMEPAQKNTKDLFNRTAYLNFNSVSRQYEYFSLDSRLPQMMNERSSPAEVNSVQGPNSIELKGGHFVAPVWGKATNVPFKYRLSVGEVLNDRQAVQLYLTPESGPERKEFLAFEYIYTRQ
jgi:hypothetical protein